jgi:hypothetical protein
MNLRTRVVGHGPQERLAGSDGPLRENAAAEYSPAGERGMESVNRKGDHRLAPTTRRSRHHTPDKTKVAAASLPHDRVGDDSIATPFVAAFAV